MQGMLISGICSSIAGSILQTCVDYFVLPEEIGTGFPKVLPLLLPIWKDLTAFSRAELADSIDGHSFEHLDRIYCRL